MPNWAQNQLIVRGAPSALKDFSEAAAGLTSESQPTPLSFEALVPTPPHLLEDAGQAAHGECDFVITAEGLLDPSAENCLDWRDEHWGVKWELEEPAELRSEPEKLTFWFYAAWTGPVELIAAVAKRFPALGFELVYSDGTMSHAGVAKFEDSEAKHFEEFSLEADAALAILECYWPEEAGDWRNLIELDQEDAEAA